MIKVQFYLLIFLMMTVGRRGRILVNYPVINRWGNVFYNFVKTQREYWAEIHLSQFNGALWSSGLIRQ